MFQTFVAAFVLNSVRGVPTVLDGFCFVKPRRTSSGGRPGAAFTTEPSDVVTSVQGPTPTSPPSLKAVRKAERRPSTGSRPTAFQANQAVTDWEMWLTAPPPNRVQPGVTKCTSLSQLVVRDGGRSSASSRTGLHLSEHGRRYLQAAGRAQGRQQLQQRDVCTRKLCLRSD